MERQLKDYLPIFTQEYAEINAIMDSEQTTIERAWVDAENMLKDQFVVDATEDGVKRWESILNMKPKGTYTLDERKFNILVKLKEQLPYTMPTLKSALASLCGEDGYTLKLDNGTYTLIVKLALWNENNVQVVSELLDKMIPANIVKKVMLFNTHLILSDYTHEQLAAFKHKEVRESMI